MDGTKPRDHAPAATLVGRDLLVPHVAKPADHAATSAQPRSRESSAPFPPGWLRLRSPPASAGRCRRNTPDQAQPAPPDAPSPPPPSALSLTRRTDQAPYRAAW